MREETETNVKSGLVTVGELAKFLSCTPRALYKLIRRQRLGESDGVFRPFGRDYRIDKQKFLHARGMAAAEVEPHEENPVESIIKGVLGNLMPMHTDLTARVTQLGEDIKRLQRAWELSLRRQERLDASSNHTPHRKRR